MGGLYLDMFLAQLVAGGSSVFAAMGPLPSPTPPVPVPSQHRASSSVSAPSAFAGVAHSLKEPSHQSAHSASPRTDDMTLAIAMSMLSSGPLALKIAIVSPKGARQVLWLLRHALISCTGFFLNHDTPLISVQVVEVNPRYLSLSIFEFGSYSLIFPWQLHYFPLNSHREIVLSPSIFIGAEGPT
jgi:hypothetical protein